MNFIFLIFTSALMLIFALFLRIYPLLRYRNRGCDSFYFLLTAEEFRKQKKIPIRLPPYYLLDIEEQWYPPGFTIFLSLFPKSFLGKYYWVISPLLDCVQLIVVYYFTFFLTGSWIASFLAGILYSLTPTLIEENSSLNSRALASLLLTAFMLSLFFLRRSSIGWIIVPLILGMSILLTHKLTIQAIFFVLFFLLIVDFNPYYLILLFGTPLFTLIMSKGFYWKVLKGHYDILKFWNRNWRNLGAHQIYDSPVYYDKQKKRIIKKKHWDTLRKISDNTRQIRHTLSSNPLICALFYLLIFHHNLLGQNFLFLTWWGISIFILGVLTSTWSKFRFLGEGYKYIKYSVFPVSIVVGANILSLIRSDISYLALLVFLLIVALGKIFLRDYPMISSARERIGVVDSNSRHIINFVKRNDLDRILCLPASLCDMLVYYCRVKVLWGTHHYNFNSAVQPFFPVLQKPIQHFVKKYDLKVVVTDDNYVDFKQLKVPDMKEIYCRGKYHIYSYSNKNKMFHKLAKCSIRI
ncbi:hypothetical protein ES702_00052 [subsurface metagenome]